MIIKGVCRWPVILVVYLPPTPTQKGGWDFVAMFFFKFIILEVFCSMVPIWRWGRYRVTAYYIRYLYKTYNTIENY